MTRPPPKPPSIAPLVAFQRSEAEARARARKGLLFLFELVRLVKELRQPDRFLALSTDEVAEQVVARADSIDRSADRARQVAEVEDLLDCQARRDARERTRGRDGDRCEAGRPAPCRPRLRDGVFVPTFDDAVTLTFTVEDGRATKATLVQGGQTIEAERIR